MIRKTGFLSKPRFPVFAAASPSVASASASFSRFHEAAKYATPRVTTVCPQSALISSNNQPKMMSGVPPATASTTAINTSTSSRSSVVAPHVQAVVTQTRSFCNTNRILVRGSGHGASSVQANYTPATQSGGGSTADSLTPQVRAHLVRVYNLLGAGVGAASVSCAAMILTPLGKIVPWWFPMFGGMVPLFWLMWKPPASVNARLGLFFAFTTLEGMALGPIVKMTLAKGVLGSALVMTGAVFVGFSLAAYLSPRASLLAFQGPLIGMLMGMIAISILNIFYPTAFAHSIILYGGLAIFSAFVAVDTQAMIERARCGAGDHVQDAMQMFLNVMNIFIRIAQILGMSNN